MSRDPRTGDRAVTHHHTRREVLFGLLAGAATVGLGLGISGCSDDADADADADAVSGSGSGSGSGAARTASADRRAATTTVPQDLAPKALTGTTKIVVPGSQGGQQITQLTGADVRGGSSVVIDVDGDLTVVDCGAGSMHRLAEAGYDANQVRTVLITHGHADHVIDLDAMVSFAWSSGRNGAAAERRIDVYGPTGLGDYEASMKRSLRRSIEDQEGPLGQVPAFGDFAHWHEFEPPERATTIVSTDHVLVETIRVQHGAMPSVGYRVRTADTDVVFSGDRGADGDDFVDFARGADILFHEVIEAALVEAALAQQDTTATFIDHLVLDHTDVTDVGPIATAAGVATLVLYHLVPGNPGITDARWTELVRPGFAGRSVAAKDLLVI